MNTADFSELILMITGPTYLRPEVREAGKLPEFGHRDTSEASKRFTPVCENLKKIAQVGDDYGVAIINGSGSYAMETTIRSMVSDSDKVLNVSVGAFGDLYHKMAVINGKNGVQLKFGPGKAIDLNMLEDTLKKERPQVVTFTHNETSTGVENDVKKVCDLIHQYSAIALVDGVSIFGGSETHIEKSKVMLYSFATQKSLGLPAGFGILVYHKDALKKAATVKNRGYTTDLIQHAESAEKFETLTTPNCTLANQMAVQTDYIVNVETVEKRFARHKAMRDITAKWISSLGDGFYPFAQKGYESPTVSSVAVPKEVDTKVVKSEMRKMGYLFDAGYSKMNKSLKEAGINPTIRIGHMGDITEGMLKEYLKKLEGVFLK